MMRELEMDLPVEEVEGFTADRALPVTKVTIHSRSGDAYPLTGFPAKKLQGWLQEIGIQELP